MRSPARQEHVELAPRRRRRHACAPARGARRWSCPSPTRPRRRACRAPPSLPRDRPRARGAPDRRRSSRHIFARRSASRSFLHRVLTAPRRAKSARCTRLPGAKSPRLRSHAHSTSLDSVSYPRYSRRMSFRRLVAPLALVAACAHAPHSAPPSSAGASITPSGPVKAVSSEEDYNTARAEYDALTLHAPERAARRAALEGWLIKQLDQDLDHHHLEEAYEELKQAATLWDPEELAGSVKDEPLREAAVRIEQAFKKRGAHEEVIVALVLEMKLAPGDASVRARYDGITAWLRAGGATESEIGAMVDGRGRVIEDLETVSRLFPTPFVVDELTRLYFERHDAGIANDPLGLGRRPRARGGDLRAILQGGPRPSTAYDLARLYLRISKPEVAAAKLGAHQDAAAGRRADPRAHRALGRQAGDAARRHQRRRPARAGSRRLRRRRARVHRRDRALPASGRAASVRGADRHAARSARRRHARVRSGAPAAADEPRDLAAAGAAVGAPPLRHRQRRRTSTSRRSSRSSRRSKRSTPPRRSSSPASRSTRRWPARCSRSVAATTTPATCKRRWSTSSARWRSSRRRPRSSRWARFA